MDIIQNGETKSFISIFYDSFKDISMKKINYYEFY